MLLICSSSDSELLALCKSPNPSLVQAAHKMYLMAGLGQAVKDKEWFSDYVRDACLEHCSKSSKCCELNLIGTETGTLCVLSDSFALLWHNEF